jgi:hypothetical protein
VRSAPRRRNREVLTLVRSQQAVTLPFRRWHDSLYSLAAKGPELDLRRFSRYLVSGPATFTWREEKGQMQGNGWTRDINHVGAYIHSASCPPPGTRMDLQILLPPLGKAGRILKVQMDAHVLRVDAKDARRESTGFAVRCAHMSLRQGNEDVSGETLEDFEFGAPGT